MSRAIALSFAVVVVVLSAATMLSPRPARASGTGGIISTVAGGGVGDGGPATMAGIAGVVDVATDGAGNLYTLSNSLSGGNDCRVRKVSAGTISTVAGNGGCLGPLGEGVPATSVGLYYPGGLAIDTSGDLYIPGGCTVWKVTAGIISRFAGNNTCTYSGDGVLATSAGLNDFVGGVAVDGAGDVYIADTYDCRIRKVSAGIISTIAGGGSCAYSGDGSTATAAGLRTPQRVAVASNGDIYFSEHGYTSTYVDCRVRKVSAASSTITTVAGNGTCASSGDDGLATDASLAIPNGVALDADGNLFIADGCHVRRVAAADGIITNVAGGGSCAFAGDGGLPTAAGLTARGVAIEGSDVYVADPSNCRVHKVSGATITTVAGLGCTYIGDGEPATAAALALPRGVTVSGATLYIADTDHCEVRAVVGGMIASAAGTGTCGYGGDNGPPTAASLNKPWAVAVDQSNGDLYIADYDNCRIRRVRSGMITTVAGDGACAFGGDGGLATAASLSYPRGLAVDAVGNLYIADTGNCRIRKVTAGMITTVAGSGVCQRVPFGGDGGPAINAPLFVPSGVAVDGAGALYVADPDACAVRKIVGGVISTFAGDWTCGYTPDGSPAYGGGLQSPTGVALDGLGNVYLTNSCNVREITGGIITTIVGYNSCDFSGDGGPATLANISFQSGIALAANGTLYIADTGNSRVRAVSPQPPRDHKTDANGDGYSAADEETIANCGAVSCANVLAFGTAETKTCKDAGRSCGTPGAPVDESVAARIAVPPADGYGCSVTLDTVGMKKTTKLAQSDIDLDGTVSILDISKVASWFGNTINASPADPRWEGDMDGDGHITILDLAAMASNFYRSVSLGCQIE